MVGNLYYRTGWIVEYPYFNAISHDVNHIGRDRIMRFQNEIFFYKNAHKAGIIH